VGAGLYLACLAPPGFPHFTSVRPTGKLACIRSHQLGRRKPVATPLVTDTNAPSSSAIRLSGPDGEGIRGQADRRVALGAALHSVPAAAGTPHAAQLERREGDHRERRNGAPHHALLLARVDGGGGNRRDHRSSLLRKLGKEGRTALGHRYTAPGRSWRVREHLVSTACPRGRVIRLEQICYRCGHRVRVNRATGILLRPSCCRRPSLQTCASCCAC